MALLNTDYVIKSLRKLDVTKSTGTDEIWPRLLKMAGPFIEDM